MTLEELRQTWHQEMSAGHRPPESLVGKMKEMDREARFGRNVVAALSLAVLGLDLFVWLLVKPGLNVAQLLSMVLITGLFFYLWYEMSRALQSDRQDDWTFAGRLEMEIDKTRRQISSDRSMPVRLLIPLFFAAMLGAYGGYYGRTGTLVPDGDLLIYTLLAAGLFAGTAWVMIRQEKTKLAPVLTQLLSLRQQVNEGLSESTGRQAGQV